MADRIRLYLDEDTVSRALIKALRARNVDVLSAHEAKKKSVADSQHLDYATSVSRVVFTFNTKHFTRLHAEYLADGRSHAGIIVSDQLQVGVILRRLLKLMDAKSAADMQNRLEFLSNWK